MAAAAANSGENREPGMDCERVDLLLGLVEDELDAGERAAVEEHLTSCEPCRETVEAYRSTRQELADLPLLRPSEDARASAYAAVMAAMEQAAPAESGSAAERAAGDPGRSSAGGAGPRGMLIPFVRLAAAAAAVLLAVTLWTSTGNRAPSATASRTADAVDEAEQQMLADPAAGAPAPAPVQETLRLDAAKSLEKAKEQGAALRDDLAARRQKKQEAERREAVGLAQAEAEGAGPGAARTPRARAEEPAKPAEASPMADEAFDGDDLEAKRDYARSVDKRRFKGGDGKAEAEPLLDTKSADDADADAAPGAPPAPPEPPEDDLAEDAPLGVMDEGGVAAKDGFPKRPAGGEPNAAGAKPLAGRENLEAKLAAREAAWTVSGPNGLRLYALRGSRLVYRDLPIEKDTARAAKKSSRRGFSYDTPVGRVEVRGASPAQLGRDAGLTRAADGRRDQRVSDELLAILASELRASEPSAGARARGAPAAEPADGAPESAPMGDAAGETGGGQLALSPERRERVVVLLRALGESSNLAERPAVLLERMRQLERAQLKMRRAADLEAEGR